MKRLKGFQVKNRHYLLLSFLSALVTAALLFVPFIVLRGGVFYYFGDFNVQEIPFYQLVHDAVRNGEMGWSHLTDLGSDLLSSYSFYLMGSPFFWMTIPFPNWMVPYLIGPLLILKFACASLSAHIYLKRYVQNQLFAVLGGLLYAFSGFSIYNVFFFHFHEPMIVFPLLLAALDAFLYDNRRGVFALAVFAACAINYYFFAGQVVFVIIYFLMITLTKTYKFRIKNFLLLALETLVGFAGAALILLPSVLGIMGNPRLNYFPKNWPALVFAKEQRYWLIILAFLFPADMPAMPVFTPESDCKWASVAGWLPLFGMTGVIAYLQSAKRDWLKKLITLLMLFAFVPVLNSLFQLLNSSIFYARWYYMLVMMMILATLRALENHETDWQRATLWSATLTFGAAVLIGLMPKATELDDGSWEYALGVENGDERFWFYVAIAMISLFVFVLIYKKFLQSPKRLAILCICSVLAISLASSYYILGYCAYSSSTTEKIKNDVLNKRDGVEIDDIEEVRSDFYKNVDNVAMFWKIPSITCFQSSVSPAIMQFYNALGIDRDVSSEPNYACYELRSLLSCKYFFDDIKNSDNPDNDESFINKDGETKMPYWKYVETYNGFKIYENECYIPMGFCYDEFVTKEEFERLENYQKYEALLRFMVLERETMKKYSDITGYEDYNYSQLYSDSSDSFQSKVDKLVTGNESYKRLCDDRKKTTCDKFEYTKTGFTAKYTNDGDENLMFFSVPYSTGWSAKINGESVDVEKVSYGFMAVKIPADTVCDIEFTYETPGWSVGCLISLCALGVFAVYMVCVIGYRIYRKRRQ